MKELVDDNDATQTAWAKEEVISLKGSICSIASP